MKDIEKKLIPKVHVINIYIHVIWDVFILLVLYHTAQPSLYCSCVCLAIVNVPFKVGPCQVYCAVNTVQGKFCVDLPGCVWLIFCHAWTDVEDGDSTQTIDGC